MKRENIDFTDRELYYIATGLGLLLSERNSYHSRGTARILNSVINKVVNNGMKRKSKKKILSPLIDFGED